MTLGRSHDKHDKDQGFTLIELLVVLIIVGVLAAVAVPVFLNQRKRAVDASLRADLKHAAAVVETWSVGNSSTAVPSETVYGPNMTGTSTNPLVVLADLKVSPRNVIQVRPGTATGSYVLCGWSPNSTWATGPDYAFRYDSSTGGMVGTRSFDVGAC